MVGHRRMGPSDMTQREVEIVVGMVLVLIGILLLSGEWPDVPARGGWPSGSSSLSLAPAAHFDSGRSVIAPAAQAFGDPPARPFLASGDTASERNGPVLR